MLKYQNVLKQLFSSGQASIATVEEAKTRLLPLAENAAPIEALMALHKTSFYQASSYEVGDALFTMMSDSYMCNTLAASDKFAENLNNLFNFSKTNVTSVQDLASVLRGLADDGNNLEYCVGYIEGSPIKIKFESLTGAFAQVRLLYNIGDYNYTQFAYLADAHLTDIEDTIFHGKDGSGATFNWTLDQVCTALSSGVENNAVICSLIEQATLTGKLTGDQASRIIQLYPLCSVSLAVKSYVSSTESISAISLLALLKAVLNNCQVDHNDSSDKYQPLSTPTYIDNVIAAALSLSAGVLSVVLSLVLNIGGIVLTIITSVFEKLKAVWDTHIIETVGYADHDSLYPVCNYPSRPVDMLISSALPNAADRDMLNQFGAVATNIDGLTIVFGKASDTLCFIQAVINGIDYNLNGLEGLCYNFIFNPSASGDYAMNIQYHTIDIGNQSSASRNYATYLNGDNDLTRIVGCNALTACRANATICWSDSDIAVYAHTVPVGLSTQDVTFDFYLEKVSKYCDSIGANYVPGTFSALAAAWPDIALEKGITSSSWFNTLNWDGIMKILSSKWFQQDCFIALSSISKAFSRGVTSSVVPGNQCFDPAIICPTRSKNSLLSAAVLSTLAAVATVATAVSVTKFRRARSVSRLACAEANFAEAKDAYASNPTDENASKLWKANKKLTRAWRRASRAGLTMYNGFGTGTPALSIQGITEPISKYLDANSNEVYTCVDIVKLIQG